MKVKTAKEFFKEWGIDQSNVQRSMINCMDDYAKYRLDIQKKNYLDLIKKLEKNETI